MFDAGSIEASLTVRTDQFDKDMTAAEARVKKFESERHEIKIAAVFDSSSLSRARQQFAQLDQQISKDAMARLRSNPQGSVLGALNALFSPHPVTGAPSASQAAQQGLLGKVIQVPGAGPGAPGGQNVIQEVTGSGGAQSNANQRPTDNSITTTDRVNTVGLPTSGGTITTTDRVNVTGLPTSGGSITTADKIEPQVDETSLKAKASQAGKDAADAADDALTKESRSRGSGWFSGFLSGIPDMIGRALAGAGGGGGGKDAGGKNTSGGGSPGSFGGNLVSAIGPGILGTSFKTASIAGLAGAGIGGIPALAAGLAPLGVGGAGLGIAALGAKELIGTANQKGQAPTEGPLFAQAQAAGQALQKMVQDAAAGLVTPLKNLFAQIPSLAKQITPALSQVFSGTVALIQPAVTGLVNLVKEIGPGLSEAFKATGPLLEPLITGLGQLVGGLMPGLVSLLKAAGPAVQVVSGFFASLGANLGQMFKDFSTVIGPSSTILKALLDVVTGLLPVFGSLAQILASAIGPAFTAFAGALQALEPFLVTVGKIFAQFAGAVLTDLSAGLQLVANILKAVAPAFDKLAAALGQVFQTLENKGGFAQLGDVLESLATPIGNLITKLADGLAPAIPPLLTLFGDLVNVASKVATSVLTALIPPLTNLAEIALGAIVKILPQVIPLVTQFIATFTADAGQVITQVGGALLNLATVVLTKLLQAAQPLIPVVLSLLNAVTPLLNILTPVVAGTITAIADALAAVVNAIPAGALTAAAVGIGAVVLAVKAWGAATAVVEAVMGSGLVEAIGEAVTTVVAFTAAAEGATAAEAALVAGELAFEAISPFAWAAVGAAGLAALTYALVATNAQAQTIVGSFAQQEQQLNYNISGYKALTDTITNAAGGYQKFAQSSTDAVRGGAAGAAALSRQLTAQAQQVSATGAAIVQRATAMSQALGVSTTVIEQWANAAGISGPKFGSAAENVGSLTQQVIAFVNKNASAVTATASLSTNLTIFGNDVFSATTQLDAFNQIWNTLVGNLLTKQQAITQGQQAFDNLKQSIKDTGATSDQSQQSFQSYIDQIGSSASTLEKSGASVDTINSYLQTQIDHLTSLGPLNKQEQADVDALRSFQDALANSTHGLTDAQTTWISQAEAHIIPDLDTLHANTPKVNTDIANLANSIAQTGTTSSTTESDRAQLIKDLEAAGVSAQTAAKLVDSLTSSLSKVPKSVTTSVGVFLSASGEVKSSVSGLSGMGAAELFLNAAAGGPVTGPGGPADDRVPAMLSNGEWVINAASVGRLQQDFGGGVMAAINSYAAGGPAGATLAQVMSQVSGASGFAGSQGSKFASLEGQDFARAVLAQFKQASAAAAAAAGPGGGTPSANAALAQKLYPQYAAGPVWAAWNAVAMAESGWNQFATNPSSGAYGIPQALPFTKMPKAAWPASAGGSSNPTAQIEWMWNYMASVYGGPIGAWQHEQQFHWYGNGGPINEPVLGMGLRSGDRYMLGERGSEMVTPVGGRQSGSDGPSMADVVQRLDRLIRATEQVPAGVGAHVGGAINGAASDASFRSRYPRGGA